jgi:hypothetical protein
VSARISVAIGVLPLALAGAAAAQELPLAHLGAATPPPLRVLPRAPEGPPALHLAWMDVTGAALGLEGFALPEARRLLESMGVRVTWRRADAGEGARSSEVRVILVDRAASKPHGVPILGSTPSSVEAAPFVWIHLPNVRAALGIDRRASVFSLDVGTRREFGVSLGRVVAHEVVHAVAPWIPHGTGLMAEQLRRADLTAARIAVSPDVALAVREALRGVPAPTEPGPAVLAVESPR